MKIGDVVKTMVGAALVIGVAYGYESTPRPGYEGKMPSEIQVRYLKTPEIGWVLAHNAEALSETR